MYCVLLDCVCLFVLSGMGRKCVRRGGVKKGGTWRTLGFLTGDMEDRVILDVMNDVLLPHGRYPENFVLISQLEVCQEGEAGQEGGYLKEVEGS